MLAPSPGARDFRWGSANVSSISRFCCISTSANQIVLRAPESSPAAVRRVLHLFAAALTAATLAACAQGPMVSDQPAARTTSRYASLGTDRKAAASKRAATTTARAAAETRETAHGVASFYRPTQTASGEKVVTGELTAAHRTLPFGTRVRVTDVATGKSVTVRVNDRGPFIPGRVVDVSHSAAESLGITGRGLAKVKLDVVQ